MRIAVIISEFPSLNETFVLDHITGLIDRGHDVHIYATAPNGEPKIHEEIESYKLLGRTVYRDNRKFTMPHNRFLRVAKGIPLLAKGLLNNPIGTLNSVNVFRLGKSAASLTALYKAAPFIATGGNYDIVHCHFAANGELAASMREIGAIRGKIIIQFHGYNRPYFQNQTASFRFPNIKKADLFLTGSEHSKRFFDQVGWSGEKMIVHRYSVPVGLFDAFKPKRNDGGQVRLLSVGRLVEKKGFQYGIMGVAKIIRRFPNVYYEIAGDGPLSSSLARLITDLGAGDNIRLLGWRDRKEIVRLLQQTDIFLAPCVTAADGDQETGPVVLLEAMVMGLPVVATWHTGIPEFVQDGESGFLVAERDEDGIADRLTRLLTSPETWREMGQKGRKRVEEHHNLEKQNDRLVEIYRLLLEERFPSQKVQGQTVFDAAYIPEKIHS